MAVKKWVDPEMGDDSQEDFRRELMVLAELRHPHIVQFLGAALEPPHCAIILEYMPYTLHHVLHESTYGNQ